MSRIKITLKPQTAVDEVYDYDGNLLDVKTKFLMFWRAYGKNAEEAFETIEAVEVDGMKIDLDYFKNIKIKRK